MHIFKKIPKLNVTKSALLLIVFFLVLVFYFNFEKLFQIDSVPIVENISILDHKGGSIIGLPIRLKIPSIDIDVAIEYVGLTPDGAMDIPKSTNEVGWFEFGERPGEEGSAVIAGHYGMYAGKPSVFDKLNELGAGDNIYIEDDKGAVIYFIVREKRSYDPLSDATEVFSSDDEKSHLNLITCEGIWDKNNESFSKRLVIFADKKQ